MRSSALLEFAVTLVVMVHYYTRRTKTMLIDTGVQTDESHNTENVTTTPLFAKQIDLISDLWSDYDGFRIRREDLIDETSAFLWDLSRKQPRP